MELVGFSCDLLKFEYLCSMSNNDADEGAIWKLL